jgi:hypothetical protein
MLTVHNNGVVWYTATITGSDGRIPGGFTVLVAAYDIISGENASQFSDNGYECNDHISFC